MSLIVFSGNIGSGKTTMAIAVANSIGSPLILESVDENPYLSNYYEDMKRWAFNLATYNLEDRAAKLNHLGNQDGVIDRSIYEDKHIFVRLQYDLGIMSKRDYDTYCKLWELIVPKLRSPDLLVFLDSSVDLCIERIKIRNRSIEIGIPYEYMVQLDKNYREWIEEYNASPILRIHAEEIDYVSKSSTIDAIHNILSTRQST